MAERFTAQVAADVAGDDLRRLVGDLPAAARDVRGEHDAGGGQQPGAGRDRLLGEDVEAGAGQLPGFQGVADRVVVQQHAPGAVDEHRAARHRGELVAADHAGGLRGDPGVQRDDAGAGEEVVEGDLLGDAGQCFGAHVGVVDEDAGAHGVQDLGDAAADGAEADQADGGAVDLDAAVVVVVVVAAPDAAAQVGVGVADAAGGGQQQGEGVFGGGGGVAAGGVADGDAVPGGGFEVGVDRAAAAGAEELEVGAVGEDALGERAVFGDADLDALEGLDHLVLGAGRLDDLGDRAERGVRPAELELAYLQGRVAGRLAYGRAEQARADEVVAGGEDGGGHATTSRRSAVHAHGKHLSMIRSLRSLMRGASPQWR
ncbi:hypothetical protein GCM10010211_13030 [Streptomyces albospinus]|uniref:Uncharacterized protein n=1 Tax=Streptomyces albospinus TaxID=285515 RepID=A0ABQ2URD1_9ACTN|nr:hypothetical protein GCM10010211_13030 [Streptomyces albospinus]